MQWVDRVTGTLFNVCDLSAVSGKTGFNSTSSCSGASMAFLCNYNFKPPHAYAPCSCLCPGRLSEMANKQEDELGCVKKG